MEENNKVTKLTQRDYQKKYDEKTQSITIKYTPADMKDYDRLMKYLERTGKSRSSFIKEQINEFFENLHYEVRERKIAEYYQDYNVDDEYLEKLKQMLGEEKYNIAMRCHAEAIKYDLTMAFEEYGCAFEDWIDQLASDIERGDVNIDVPDKEFKEMIDRHLCESVGSVCYS